jgi:hypothetical protein
VKITDVQVLVLESPQSYGASEGSEEAHGIKYLGIVKVTTDAGLTGYADLETQPHVARAIVDAPSEGSVTGFLGLRSVLLGRAAVAQDVYGVGLLRQARRGDPGDLGN